MKPYTRAIKQVVNLIILFSLDFCYPPFSHSLLYQILLNTITSAQKEGREKGGEREKGGGGERKKKIS